MGSNNNTDWVTTLNTQMAHIWGFCGTTVGRNPLSAWLIRRTSEAPDLRRSWAGVLGASGRGSVVPSVGALYLRRSGLRGGWRWLSCLLNRRRPRATGSSRRAGAFREEVLHRLRSRLSLCEAFCKALHSWSKQAA